VPKIPADSCRDHAAALGFLGSPVKFSLKNVIYVRGYVVKHIRKCKPQEQSILISVADKGLYNLQHISILSPLFGCGKDPTCHVHRKVGVHRIMQTAVRDLDKEDIVPSGFSVAQNEWEDGSYPEVESISVARKDVNIVLPFSIWWPRAVRWARTLELVLQLRILEE
jgi:hypothetical protein